LREQPVSAVYPKEVFLEELQLALTSARVDQRNFGLWINNWQIGQTLNALVTNQRPTGELVLRVGGQQITATADIPIQQGATLLLEVKQLQPVPLLRVLNPAASPAASTVGGTLQLLSQTSSAVSSTPLATVVQAVQSGQLSAAVPVTVIDSLSQLLRLVSRAERVTLPEGLAAALRNSGVFFESALAAAGEGKPASPGGDLKAGLFQALARVDAALEQAQKLSLPASDAEALWNLKRELEAGLGRITVNQLASQPGESAARHWQLEIPVQLAGDVHSLRVELDQEPGAGRGSAGEDDPEDRWNIRLALAPAALGALEVKMRLQGDALDLRFAAANETVRQLIDAGLPRLANALASRGISLTTTPSASLKEDPLDIESAPQAGSTLDLRA
jgi:flagellar hook-length control protein FliK